MPGADSCPETAPANDVDSDDEGMGDEEDSSDDEMQPDDSGFASMNVDVPLPSPSSAVLPVAGPSDQVRSSRTRHSAPSALPSPAARPHLRPNYKLLHQTHVRLRNRFTAGSYTLSNLQTRGAPNSHSNTIYCLQLYTYPETGTQVLFTGSKDRTIREWDLATGAVIRVLDGVHESSVLSICVHRGLLASASSDRRVVIWDLAKSAPLKIIRDHEDSVLIASVDFSHPFVLSGSSDKHIRLLDVSTLQGWSTSPSADNKPPVVSELGRGVVCEACGSNAPAGEGSQPPPRRRAHEDLVRSVALGSECVVSGSYDFTVKVRYITKYTSR
ncbi:F-box/WD repeat-containing protein 11 [Trametes pubescens]|uniref:F-box/WD repeat-containing protein 11 n=1 Tax=Trametes pubescens TaxID=154538 RepID=A0A1M2VTT0_TRAPU|nr:F-box/WD repeat-containing protein 11 [Trametes pubescens]